MSENTTQKIRIGKGLQCGCCGDSFRVWEGYEDQDQDRGYGICMDCQGDSDLDNIEHYIDMFDKVEAKLKDQANHECDEFIKLKTEEERSSFDFKSSRILSKFQSSETWQRIGFINRLIEKGFFSYSVCR